MTAERNARFLALLVHRGLLDAGTARRALAAPGEPEEFLVGAGLVTREQWREWVSTAGGSRPKLARYELFELLGEGGTARVWRARDRKSGDIVALKILEPGLAQDARARERFVQESQLLIGLRHANIVQGLRVAREGDIFFCAMELIDGVCLLERLQEQGPLPEELALRVVVQIAGALACLHGRGLVHRDVKPGNIMVGENGRAVLIDLGFAVESAGAAQASDTTAGTVHYISPEQARGQGDLDVRADIYSLGATLYHLLTGSLPFEARTSEEVLAKQVLEELSGQRIRAMGLSPQAHYFIEKMMAKEKEIRFQTPDQLSAEISAHLEAVERERAAAPAPRQLRQRRRPRHRRGGLL